MGFSASPMMPREVLPLSGHPPVPIWDGSTKRRLMTPNDISALSAWLSDHLDGFDQIDSVEKFKGGQSNPTFRLVSPGGPLVLRRKPAGVLLKSAHAVDREFRVQKALAGSAVPVAGVHLLCEDDSIIGSAFYIMDEVAGRIFDDPRLLDLSPSQRDAILDEMNRVLAAIHSIDIADVGLQDFGPEGNYFARQLGRWTKQYRASETETLPDMDALITWLEAHLPEDDGQRCLVHGDYRLDNLIFAPNTEDCHAVLDWELSTIGHPYADLAGVIMQWALPPGSEGRGLGGVDRDALGLWSDQRFVETYCARRGLAPIRDFGFYLAFSFFRMGAILQCVKKRGLDGNATDP